jgi:hypothetical protein
MSDEPNLSPTLSFLFELRKGILFIMKKTIMIILTIMLAVSVFVFVACGGNTTPPAEASPSVEPTATPEPTPTPTATPEPTPTPKPPVLVELHSIPDEFLMPEDEEDMVYGVEYVAIPEEYNLIKGKSYKEYEEDSI